MITPLLLYGIEIKSDADTYARLEKQVRWYNWYYDRCMIVIGSTHAAHVQEHVPEWWGIVTVEEQEKGLDFYVVREAGVNPHVKGYRKIRILWRPELNRLLEKNSLPKYAQKSKEFVQEKLLEKVPDDVLWPQAYEELFERDYNTIGEEIEQYRRETRPRKRKKASTAGAALKQIKKAVRKAGR
jgi:hypothetical protein